MSRGAAWPAVLASSGQVEASAAGMSAPLLVLDNVTKHFVVRRSLLGAPTAVVRAVDGVSLSVAAGETLALVGEFGLRQVDGRPARAAPDRADRGRGPLRRAATSRSLLGRRAAPRPRRRAAHLPGPLRLAQPAHDGRRDAGRAAAAAHRPVAGEPPRARRRSAAHRRPEGRARPALSARVLGRPAPAHRHRPRAGGGAEADRLRRAGVGARRLDPQPDPQPAEGPAAAARASPTSSSATTWPW